MKKIEVFSKKHGIKQILVDDDDYGYLTKFKWHIYKSKNTFYARRNTDKVNGKSDLQGMHRQILGLVNSEIIVDHIDHNGLNNQRSNLRNCNNAQNQWNRSKCKKSPSKYMGVALRKRIINGREFRAWRASLTFNKKHIHIKEYPCTPEGELLAAKAYDIAAKKYYGGFANLNFKD